jgi:hypothetical protein
MADVDPFGASKKRSVFDPDAPIAKTSAAASMMSEFPVGADPPAESEPSAPASTSPRKKFVPKAKKAQEAEAGADSSAKPAESKVAAARAKFVRPKPAAAADTEPEIFIAAPKPRPASAVSSPEAAAPVAAAPTAATPAAAPAASAETAATAATAAPPVASPALARSPSGLASDPFGVVSKSRFDPDAPIAKTSAASSMMSEFPPDAAEDAAPAAKPAAKKPPARKPPPAKKPEPSTIAASAAAAAASSNGDDADAAPPASSRGLSNSPPLKPKAAPAMTNADEFPDGAGENGAAGGADEVFSGPLETRLVHKNWKARVQAFDEMKGILEAVDADDDEARKAAADRFAPFLKKIVNDPSVPALESGLQAVAAWVDKASFDHGAPEAAEEIMAALLKKGFGSSRPATRAAADQLTLLLVECSAVESVMSVLIPGTQSNVPKIAQSCAALLVQALKDFGPGVMVFEKMQKALPKILAHINNGVRQEAMNLAVELYRWMGAIFTNHLKSLALKSSQQTELDALFEKVTLGQARPVKFVRSQAGKAAAAGGKKGKGSAAGAGGDEGAAFDPLSLVKPVDIAAKLSKGWCEKAVSAPKWQEKKERLGELLNLAEASAKIEVSPALIDVIAALKKCLKDSNVVIVGDTLKVIGALAKGTRRGFYTYGRQIFPTLIQLLKEKKSNVSIPLQQCLDIFAELGIVELFEVLEPIVEGLADKVSQVRVQLCQFLQRWLASPRTTAKGLKDAAKPLAEALAKLILTDPEVEPRNVATAALAELVATVTRKPLTDLLKRIQTAEAKRYEKLDQLINASGKNAVSSSSAAPDATVEEEEPASAPAAASSKSLAKAKSLPPKRPGSAAPQAFAADEPEKIERKSSLAPPASARVGPPKRAVSAGLGRATRVERAGSIGQAAAVASSDVEAPVEVRNGNITRIDLAAKALRIRKDTKRVKGNFREWGPDELEEIAEALRTLCSEDLATLLLHKDFAKQMQGIDLLDSEIDSNMEAVQGCSDVLLKYLAWRLCDANTSLLIKVMAFSNKLLTALQTNGYKLSDGEAANLLPFLIEKVFGHNTDRFRDETRALLTIFDSIYQPKSVMLALMVGFESKNKRVFSECLREAGDMIVKYGVGVCDAKKVLGSMATAVGANESHVRQSALTALAGVYQMMGDGIWPLLGGKSNNAKIPAKVMTLIEGRFKTIKPNVTVSTDDGAAAAASGPASSTAAAAAGRKDDASRTPRRSGTASRVGAPIRSPGESPGASRSAQVSPRSSTASNSRRSTGIGPLHMGALQQSSAPSTSAAISTTTGLPNCFSLDLGDAPGVPDLSQTVSRTAPSSPGRRHTAPISPTHRVSNVTPKKATVAGAPQLQVSRPGVASATLVTQLRPHLDNHMGLRLSDEARNDVMRQLWVIVQEQRPAIQDQTDEIVHFLTRQVELSFGEGINKATIDHRHARYALNTLLELFKAEEMARGVRAPTLEHLTRLLLLKLMDESLKQHPDPQCRSLTMAVNVLVLKVLENSERTAIFHTLLMFLARGSGTGAMNDPINRTFVDLVVRSLMKMVKNLANEKFLAGLHLPSLIRDIHDFMLAHKPLAQSGPSQSPGGSTDDLQTKAIKAMLSTLVTVKGEDLRKEIPRDLPPNSPAVAYIEKTIAYNNKQKLAAGGVAPAASPLPAVTATSALTASAAPSDPVARRLQMDTEADLKTATPAPTESATPVLLDPTQQLLADIVARTIKPITTQPALHELFDFTLSHPDIDIWPAFHMQGEAFKAYIKRNLVRIQAERDSGVPPAAAVVPAAAPVRSAPLSPRSMGAPPVMIQPPQPSPTVAATGGAHSRNSSTDLSGDAASSTALYRQRLSVLQDRAKIATSSSAPGGAPFTSSAAPATTPTAHSTLQPSASLSSIDAIRARFKTARSDENSAPPPAHSPIPSPSPGAPAAFGNAAAPVQPAAAAPVGASSIDAIKARIAAMQKSAAASTTTH